MVEHYGELAQEQRALDRGIGLVLLEDYQVVTVAGEDRHRWLHSLASQDFEILAGVGESAEDAELSTETLFLDANGRIEHSAFVRAEPGGQIHLITETAHELAQFLDSMRFMMRVEVTLREDLAVVGTSAAGPQLGEIRWIDPWPRVSPSSTAYGPIGTEHPGSEWSGSLWLIPRERLDEVVTGAMAAGARLAGTWAWEALRVQTWRPRWAREVDDRAIAHELDWLRTAVHLGKGCYKGQETIARVFNLGKPPRRLVFVHLDGSDHLLPEVGATVRAGEREVGRLTSVVRHHFLGPIGLALVKRNVAADQPLTVDGIAASQEVIVNPEGTGIGRPESIDRAGFRQVRNPGRSLT